VLWLCLQIQLNRVVEMITLLQSQKREPDRAEV
jgi:hypothetical protein